MKWADDTGPSMPCSKCGAARTCEHRVSSRAPLPEPKAPKSRISGGGRYNMTGAFDGRGLNFKRYAPKREPKTLSRPDVSD